MAGSGVPVAKAARWIVSEKPGPDIDRVFRGYAVSARTAAVVRRSTVFWRSPDRLKPSEDEPARSAYRKPKCEKGTIVATREGRAGGTATEAAA